MSFDAGSLESWGLERRALPALSVTSFSIPLTALVEPQGITLGPDGNLWFTESGAGAIGRMTATGALSQFTLPDVSTKSASSGAGESSPIHPEAITAGPDSALWFTTDSSLIGRISTDGTITEFAASGLGSTTSAIVAGPDGALWFTGTPGGIGRITTSGVVSEFALPQIPPAAGSAAGTAGTQALAIGIAVGPDGALWFGGVPGEVGRITTAGVVTELPVGSGTTPDAITSGPDGALWFTGSSDQVGRITTAGVVTEFATKGAFPIGPAIPTEPQAIVVGPDGALWMTDETGTIGRMTTSGAFTRFALPGNFSQVTGVVAGPDGNLWFTEQEDGQTGGQQPAIGEMTPAGVAKLYPLPQGTTLDPNRGVAANPGSITTGPDGATWFTENDAIGRITTDGTIEQFPLATPGATPEDITAGPDGSVWFGQPDSSDGNSWSICRITTSGAINVYPIPNAANIWGITGGPGGKVWFTENTYTPSGNEVSCVAWIDVSGKTKTIRLPTANERQGGIGSITSTPNGQVWFTDSWGSTWAHSKSVALGSITARGQLRMYQFLATEHDGSYAPQPPSQLIAGPSGKIWFVGSISNKPGIGRISTSGKPGPTISGETASSARDLVNLPDGKVAFDDGGFTIGLATRSGIVVTQDLPNASSRRYDLGAYGVYGGHAMTLGSDGNLWATSGTSSILRISGIESLSVNTSHPRKPDGRKSS
jgi:streptogramin lyase